MVTLHTHVFEPDDVSRPAPTVFAIHGLTGHGRRWERLARTYLPDVRVIAPDLIGHGRSPWQPPWNFDAHLDALEEAVNAYIPSSESFVLLGHSFGGALSVRLAARLGGRIAGLVLLDPAQGLDPGFALDIATESLNHWDYADADAIRAAKRAEGWAQVPAEDLDFEIAEHLINRPSGRVSWRVSAPATAVAWSEMSLPAQLPPPGVPTDIVVADQVDPPFVSTRFLAACAAERPQVRVHHVDCGHMVPLLEPQLCARLVRASTRSAAVSDGRP
ncbi:MAG: alpha/beta fold hydrolase [Gordonia sp. (in: high G+C Gram-positive bacteria)]